MGVLINYPLFHAEDSSGAPLTGGLLYTYIAGTTTAKATYTTRAMAIANANPVVLDSRGEAVIYGAGLFKLILKTAAGATIWTQDNVQLDTGAGAFTFFVDPSETDQGAAGNGASLYDILIANGASKKYTVKFHHNGVANTTEYAVGTTFDAGAYTNVTFEFENGAVLVVATGITLTLPDPSHILASPSQQIFSGAGTVAWAEGGPIQVGWFSTPAVAAATLVAYSNLEFAGSDAYAIGATIEVTTEHFEINLNGAKLTVATDLDCFDFNPDATADGAAVKTYGYVNGPGHIYSSLGAAASTKAAIKARDMRYFYIDGLILEGFEYGLDIAVRDNNFVENCTFRDNVKHIYHPTYYTAVTPQIFHMNKNSYAKGDNGVRAISIETGFNDFYVDGASIAGGDYDYGIYAITGTAAPSISSVGLHFKRISAEGISTGHYIIHVENANAKALTQVSIENSDLQTGSNTGVSLEKCIGVKISGNKFAQTAAASGVPIALDADCEDIEIDRSNQFGTAAMTFACDRNQITFGHQDVSYYQGITGYEGASFSTSNATIDMSTALAIFPTKAGMVPKSWVINIQARDSGSAASTTAKVELSRTVGIAAQLRSLLRVAGAPDDVLAGGTFVVPCDANGDIWINIVASGAGTMDIWLTVIGYFM